MSSIQLNLLGPVQIMRGNSPISSVTSPKIIALLAYLAVEHGQTHPREALSERLWPGSTTGRQNVRQSLSRLHKSLDQAASDTPFLLSDRHTISLNPAARQLVDVNEFVAGLEQVRNHNHADLPSCAICCAQLEQATALYRGDFLAGLYTDSPDFDEWVLLRREWLRQEALWALDMLTQHALAQQYDEQALALARRQLAIDPLREETHRQVMQSLARLGRPSEALAHYDQVAERLRTELDVAPAAATTALYTRLRGGSSRSASQTPRPPAPSHNLPHQFTPFIGREQMLDLVTTRLDRQECRLLTLVGPGGVGKTRLAIEAARRLLSIWGHAIFFLDLAPIDDIDHIPSALTNSLGLALPPHAQTEAERRDAFIRLLADREILLVLDNYEHLLPHTDLVTALLQGTSRLRLLITSRSPLHLRAEWLVDVEGLPTPPESLPAEQATAAHFASIALFEETAVRVKHDFAPTTPQRQTIARICRLLEGAPLALELAAARVRELPVEAIADAIAHDLDFLHTEMVDVPARHRSLRAAIDHSWQLLPPDQQAVFIRLALFRGGFSRDAAQQVAGASSVHLNELALHSLLRPHDADRYALHESLRQFVAEKLASAPSLLTEVQRRHGVYYLSLLATQEEALLGASSLAVRRELLLDYNNLRSAWSWAVSYGQFDLLDRGLEAAYRFFSGAGLVQDGRAVIEQALAAPLLNKTDDDKADVWPDISRLIAGLLIKQARFLNLQGQYEQALHTAQKAATQLADRDGTNQRAAVVVGDAWLQAGRAALHLGQYQEAEGHLEEALGIAQSAQAIHLEAEVRLNIGTLHNLQNNFALAYAHNANALDLARVSGDLYAEGIALNNLGTVADYQGEFAAAAHYMEQAVAVFTAIDYRRGTANALSNWGAANAWLGNLQQAVEAHQEALHVAKEMGDIDGEAWALMALGAVYTHLGRLDDARTYLHGALTLNNQDGTRTLEAWCLHHLAQVELEADNLVEAERLAQRAQAMAGELGDELTAAWSAVIVGEIATHRGEFSQAEMLFSQALDVNRRMEHQPGQMRVLAALARLALARNNPKQALALTNEALALEGTADLLLDRAPLLAAHGRALAALGRQADARIALEQALNLHRQMGQTHLAARLQAIMGG